MSKKYIYFRHKLIRWSQKNKFAPTILIFLTFIALFIFGLSISFMFNINYDGDISLIMFSFFIFICICIWLRRSYYSQERLRKLKLNNDLHLIVSIFNKCDCSLFIEYSNPENNKNNSSIYKEITSDNEIHILTTKEFWNMELPSGCLFDFLSLSITLNPEEDYINQKKYEIPLNRIRRLSFNDLRDEEMNENIYNCIFLPNLSEFLEPVLKKNIGS